MSSVVVKSISNLGKWAQNKAVDFEKFLKYYKDAIVKHTGKERISDVCQVAQNGNANQFVANQHNFKSWLPQLHNFQSTLKGNASKLTLQFSYRSNTSANSFFRNNILMRQARKGHLIAFAGLFLFQEENQESVEKFHHQFQIYEKICENIQNIFPTYEDKEALPSVYGSKLDQFELEKVERTSDNTVTYSAQLLPEEDDVISCSSFEFCDEKSESWNMATSFDETPFSVEPVNNDFAVKAMLPANGEQRISSILRKCEHELLCGGIDLRRGDDSAMRNDFPKALPPHPNVLKIERVFCDRSLPSTKSVRGSIPAMDQAVYLVTKRYEHTLRSYLEDRRFDPGGGVLVIAQILEAVAHLERHNVAHRNITADNIHLEFDRDGFPRVVLGEFGKAYCATSRQDMKVPFQHRSLDTRVEELSSQAPEVSKATAGRFRSVNYTKSDAWMVGCVAYKVLTGRNPFKDADNNSEVLDSRTYKEEDLPKLDKLKVPDVVKIVVEMLLARDPKKRLSASEAADILHLELFATPLHQSLCDDVKCKELRNWLNDHCAEAMVRKRENSVPFQMCQCFFKRLDSCQLSIGCRYWVLVRNTKGLY